MKLARRLLGGSLGPVLMLLTVFVLFAALDEAPLGERFTSMRNLRVMTVGSLDIAVAGLGMTLVIIAGGIDLSAGTALALSGTVYAAALKAGWSPTLALLALLVTGLMCGATNGLLISRLKVVPFIVTLGAMTAFLGVGKLVAEESTVFPERASIPAWVSGLTSTSKPDVHAGWFPNLPSGFYIALVLAALVALLLQRTVFGRHVYALGSNEATARLCGVDVARTKLCVYTLAGLLFGIAGLFWFSDIKMGNPDEGLGLELDVIAAVVIGGGSLAGGRGSVVGTLAGVLVMAVIRSGCTLEGMSTPWQDILIGVIIIAAVALDQLRAGRLAE